MSQFAGIRLVCFDNDGTLFASHEVANPAIQRRFVAFCRGYGLELAPPTDEEICRLTGKPGPEFYTEILPQPLKGLAAKFRQECLEGEVEEVRARGRLYDGAAQLLRDLRQAGRRTALVTNAGELYLGAVYQRVGYSGLLDGVYHYGKNGWTAKGEMIRSAMRDFGESSCVMVGDRASDLEGARQAGVPMIGCVYGYGTLEELAGADALAADIPALRALLLGPEASSGAGQPLKD